MPIAWYIVPYVDDPSPRTGPWKQGVTLALNIDAPELARTWDAVEFGQGYAMVKIDASDKALEKLDSLYKRLPSDRLDAKIPPDRKSDLTQTLIEAGFTQQEIDAQFPDGIDNYGQGEILKFAAARKYLFERDGSDQPVWVASGKAGDPAEVDKLDDKVGVNGIRR